MSNTPGDETSVLEITPARVEGTIRVPGSKSLTNRALVVAALAEGESTINGALFSEDTEYMSSALRDLGFSIKELPDETKFIINGQGGKVPAGTAKLFVGNSGTAMRFLTAFVALGQGSFELDGVERMRQRPIQPLLDCLAQLGADAKSVSGSGCPPVLVAANGLEGGRAVMRGDVSSQYFTAVLLSAPYARAEVELAVEGDLVSKPYVDMTIGLMEKFGVEVSCHNLNSFFIKAGQRYRPMTYDIESDASNASYFLAAAAVTGGRVRVLGIPHDSLQGDTRFADILHQMGAKVHRGDDFIEVEGGAQLSGIDINLEDCPDLAQTLAAVAVFASGKTRVRGVANLRVKETDRIKAVVTELERMGIRAQEHEDGFEIEPGQPKPATIETYDDHRMAMSFSLIGLRANGIKIKNPNCVAKTFPGYFEELKKLCHIA
ncbi:MAG: 3-phosphoshikimate 1-carboxyvinyltransferase [Planctomycetes bacterium]|nr:3-phosphoshikimate 1-carboxyvinyltransferase [Planctomycetota bacterium]